jgi:hypothetical protein
MIQENYIYIFCSYVAERANDQRLSGAEAVFLMSEFEPVCEEIKSREQLLTFISQYLDEFPELEELKEKLQNPVYDFPTPWNQGGMSPQTA